MKLLVQLAPQLWSLWSLLSVIYAGPLNNSESRNIFHFWYKINKNLLIVINLHGGPLHGCVKTHIPLVHVLLRTPTELHAASQIPHPVQLSSLQPK